MDQPTYNHFAGRNIHAMQTLSDGVFSIAMTLLVLDIRVPVNQLIHSEKDLWDALCTLTPNFVSYFMSFMTLGIFWTGSGIHFDYINQSDRHMNWISLFFLMFVSLLPFSTAFLSQHIEFKLSIAIYWLNIFLLGLILYIRWNYAVRNNYVSLPSERGDFIRNAINRRIIVAQSLYAVSALLCFISTYLSIALIVLIQLNYALAIFHRQNRGDKA